MPLERPKSVSILYSISCQELMASTLPMLSRRCSRASKLFIDRLACIVFDDPWYFSRAMIIIVPWTSLDVQTCVSRPAQDCVPPACYPPQHDHYDENEYKSDTQEGVDITIECNGNEHVMDESPPICVPPHCYPSNLPGHEHQALPNDDEDEDQSPPICVPPRCDSHSTFEADKQGRIQEDQPFTIQKDQEREQEYLNAHPEIVTTQDVEVEEGADDDDKPICMPPICVPPARSASVLVPCGEGEQDD